MGSTTEIERKYIASIDHPLKSRKRVLSIQAYLVVQNKWEWRIRKMVDIGDQVPKRTVWYTAIKIGNGFIRREFETTIPSLFGKFLMMLTPNPLVKIRTHSDGWEVDEFIGPSAVNGLVLAEAEISDPTHELPPPPMGIRLVKDVTETGGYANKHLYLNGLPDTYEEFSGRSL